MSGLFKSFDKVVSAQVLAGSHRLMLNQGCYRYNPANYYFDPRLKYSGLQQGHNYNCFSLSVMSQALVNETLQFMEIEKESEELLGEMELNKKLSQQCLDNAVSLIKAGVWGQESEVSAAVIYSLEHLLQMNESVEINRQELYKNYICPAILKNASNLSSLNIVDIVEGLVKAQYFDEQFWNEFLPKINQKVFEWSYDSTQYHGWTTDVYEHTKPQKHCSYLSSTQSTFKFYQNGGKSLLNNVTKLLNDVLIHSYIQLWMPYVQREKRFQYLFDERTANDHQQTFRISLDTVASNVPSVKPLLEQLHEKI